MDPHHPEEACLFVEAVRFKLSRPKHETNADAVSSWNLKEAQYVWKHAYQDRKDIRASSVSSCRPKQLDVISRGPGCRLGAVTWRAAFSVMGLVTARELRMAAADRPRKAIRVVHTARLWCLDTIIDGSGGVPGP